MGKGKLFKTLGLIFVLLLVVIISLLLRTTDNPIIETKSTGDDGLSSFESELKNNIDTEDDKEKKAQLYLLKSQQSTYLRKYDEALSEIEQYFLYSNDPFYYFYKANIEKQKKGTDWNSETAIKDLNDFYAVSPNTIPSKEKVLEKILGLKVNESTEEPLDGIE